MTEIPFYPTFGKSPRVLAGRNDIIAELNAAFWAGPGHPAYTSLLLGVRGMGKTVLLNAMEERVKSRGWLVISETASNPGLPDRIIGSAANALRDLTDKRRWRLISVSAFGFGAGFKATERTGSADSAHTLRRLLSELGDQMSKKHAGLLVTVDELHAISPTELRELGTVIQHVTRREEYPVALLMAGLPSVEERLLADDSVTFLHRCPRFDIGRIRESDVAYGLSEPLRQVGALIMPEALPYAVAHIGGYAFMMQLVGFYSWLASQENLDVRPAVITHEAVVRGVADAEAQVIRLVLQPMWNDLSEVDQRFALAMAVDEGESKVADIATRLDVSAGYVSVYRSRLIKAGFVISVGRGRLDFAHSATRPWLRTFPSIELGTR